MSEHTPDVVSDPSRNDEVGQEWADEGGAMPSGPATDEDADEPDTDEKE